MGAWPGKIVIGLTGNIATGKSVVRRMLEHLGAYGIDADVLAHRAISPGSPGYQPVIETFGKWILAEDGQIDRARLGKIVFADPAALKALEKIVHPLVRQAVHLLAKRSPRQIIVIEAIKLLEGELREACDSIWVTYAPEAVQLERLMKKRGLRRDLALQRIQAQAAQEEKVAAASVVIRTDNTFEETWRQVVAGLQKTIPELKQPAAFQAAQGALAVERAGPRQAAEIAAFITELKKGKREVTRAEIMAAFGEKAFLLLRHEQKLLGLIGLQVENLVARAGDIYLAPQAPLAESLSLLLQEAEKAARELLCEAFLLFLPPALVRQESAWQPLGFEQRTIQELTVRDWQEAALESMPTGTVLLYKQLRKDRVLRPV